MNSYEINIDFENIDMETDGSPHNPVANEMYSYLTLYCSAQLMEDVTELKSKHSASKIVNDIQINFKLDGKYIETNYLLENGRVITTREIYKSYATNNPPDQELMLAIAEAEVNAQLAPNPEEFELFMFPGVGFFMSAKEARSIKNRFREFMKRIYWYLGIK